MTAAHTAADAPGRDSPAPRYFTTPIYYASGEAHVGSLYANVVVNLFASYWTLRGAETLRLTGLDEHGEKIEDSARAMGKTPQKAVDDYAVTWKAAFAAFGLGYDVFMRTTAEDHKANVRRMLQICHDKGDIYYGEHEGRYCVGCEAFLTSKEMNEQFECLIHKKPTELRREGNYYFRTSKYVPEIIKRLKAGTLVAQERYVNEMLAMCDALEGDLSISRPKTRTEWGIELPFDPAHVTYVWFDALGNYVTGVGGIDAARSDPFWKGATHVVGKDILKFHAIYWPAMLLACEAPVPRLMVTGWILSGGHKMSKSLGNVIAPKAIEPYGRDALVNAIMRPANIGDDLDLTYRTYLERFNADLANGLGNLASRTFAMVEKYFDKKLPAIDRALLSAAEHALAERASTLPERVAAHFEKYEQADALQAIWELVSTADKLITDAKPWDLAKAGETARLGTVLGTVLAALRYVGYLAWPYFPERMAELLAALGEDTASLKGAWLRLGDFHAIRTGHTFTDVPKLFQRVDVNAELARIEIQTPSTKNTGKSAGASVPQAAAKPSSASSAKPADGAPAAIALEDFTKSDIRVGTVITADTVEGSDKLLRLQISLGDLGTRQVFSGIRQWVKPEEIVNRCVLVVVNLAPRKMKFGVSEGMVLSTDSEGGGVSPVYVSDALVEGARLS